MPDADDPLDALADEYAARLRAGEWPDPDEFARRLPDRADEVREVLSGVALMESLKPPPARPPAKPPTRLGDYRLVREIGRGGMGVVYEAVQESLGRRVAVKVLPVRLTPDPDSQARFEREARAAARLHHTHIVPVFDVGEADGHRFFAMQLIAGRPVDHEPPPPAVAARLVADAADALDYAHSQGVLHRDVKPSNILVDAAGQVWVTDFGVAKLADEADLTATGEVVGTLRYMAPERFAGVSDARGDVYALGVTLYELLTGRPAFVESAPSHLVRLITQTSPPPPRRLAPHLPADLETVVLTAMARDPAHRYRTVGELAADLRRFLDDRPIRARRTGPVGQLVRWGRRNPALAAAVATAAGLLVAVAGVSLVALAVTTRARQAEAEQRRQAETTATLALAGLNGLYERLSPTRLSVAPPAANGVEVPRAAALTREAADMLEAVLATYQQIVAAGKDYPRLARGVAEAQHRIGDLHGQLGRHEPAVAAYLAALDLYPRLPADAVRVRWARACNECGRLQDALHRTAEAAALHRKAVDLLTAGGPPTDPAERFELACAYAGLDRRDMFRDAPPDGPPPPPHGDRPPPPPRHRGGPPPPPPGGFGDRPPPPPDGGPLGEDSRAVELLEELAAEFPAVPEYRHLLACCLAAKPGGEHRAVELLRELVGEHPTTASYRSDLVETLIRPGPFEADRRPVEEAVTRAAALADEFPHAPGLAALHARTLDRLSQLEFEAGRPAAAEQAARAAVAVQSRLAERHPAVAAYRLWLGFMERLLARAVAARGGHEEARRLLEAAVGRVEKEFLANPGLDGVKPFLGMALRELASVQDAAGKTAEAAASRERARTYDAGGAGH